VHAFSVIGQLTADGAIEILRADIDLGPQQ
jgi:hypothetical protein